MLQASVRRFLVLTLVSVCCIWSVSGLESCDPSLLDTSANVNTDYNRLSGTWFVVGRDDVGQVDNELWNARMTLTIDKVENFGYYRCAMPNWFDKQCGDYFFHLDYYGRTKNGTCAGRDYMWGIFMKDEVYWFTYTLSGFARRSLMFIIDTDYDDFACIAHCVAEFKKHLQMSCSKFNLFLLKRQRPNLQQAAAATFDTTVLKQKLQKACTGSLQLRTTQNTAFMCFISQMTWYKPEPRL